MENSRFGLTGKTVMKFSASCELTGLVANSDSSLISLSMEGFFSCLCQFPLEQDILREVHGTTHHTLKEIQLPTTRVFLVHESFKVLTTSLDVPSTTQVHVKRVRLVFVCAFTDK